MARITYRGPHTGVVTEGGVHCPRGEPVEVDDDVAARLTRRGDFAPAPTKKAAGRKADPDVADDGDGDEE